MTSQSGLLADLKAPPGGADEDTTPDIVGDQWDGLMTATETELEKLGEERLRQIVEWMRGGV